VDRRDGEVAVQLGQLDPQRLARQRIEMGERLVQQQHARLGRERAREGEPAAVLQRQLGRPALGDAGQPQPAEHGRHAALDLVGGHALRLQAKATCSRTLM